ncbi:MAG: hypothetical protein ACHRHE_18760 [Tepidisphaerales bacterium]
MIHSHRVLFALVAWLALAGFAGAQPAPADIPQNIKTAAAIDNDAKEKIKAFVAAQFKRLVSPDPTADPQKSARDAREALAQAAKAGSQPASPEYQAVYTDAVASEAKAAFAGAKVLRVKLNIAVAVARVAENAPQTRLEPVIQMFLADGDCVPLQIWGIRASRYIMPDLVKIGSGKGLIDRILAIVKANPCTPLTEEAYEAFKPTADPKVLAAVVDPLLTIAELRIAKLQAGYAEDPYLDYKAFSALAQISTWSPITTGQRVRTMQLMANVMTWASSRADERKGPIRDQLGVLINKSAGALTVMASITAQTSNDPTAGNLASIAKAIYETSGGINVAGINYTKLTQPILPAMQAIKEFSSVKVPDSASPMTGAGDE